MSYICEASRMFSVVLNLGNTHFIRFNPDAYKPLPRYTELSETQRKNTLLKTIQESMEYESPFQFAVTYLFYDWYVDSQEETEYHKVA